MEQSLASRSPMPSLPVPGAVQGAGAVAGRERPVLLRIPDCSDRIYAAAAADSSQSFLRAAWIGRLVHIVRGPTGRGDGLRCRGRWLARPLIPGDRGLVGSDSPARVSTWEAIAVAKVSPARRGRQPATQAWPGRTPLRRLPACGRGSAISVGRREPGAIQSACVIDCPAARREPIRRPRRGQKGNPPNSAPDIYRRIHRVLDANIKESTSRLRQSIYRGLSEKRVLTSAPVLLLRRKNAGRMLAAP